MKTKKLRATRKTLCFCYKEDEKRVWQQYRGEKYLR